MMVAAGSTSNQTAPVRRRARWRFWLPLALQLALILPMPLRNTYTTLMGETVILTTEPVDPYNLLQGYYQTLRYQTISSREAVIELEGGEFLAEFYRDRRPFYIVLAQDIGEGRSAGPADWTPVRVSPERPLAQPNELFLKAYPEGNSIRYNLERYYMPESRRDELNATVADLRRQSPQAVQVEVKIDRFGRAVPVALLMGGDRFEF